MLILGKKTKKKLQVGSQINILNFITFITVYLKTNFNTKIWKI